ncbi:hypothetical protein OXYTRIMIC_264 [Oxytricha trifallax]|uniref:Uncharacterized protein n=1 Tax=Oxytricha trifallax TaxID=1172189 RepID=A0A073HWX2_9SPIT|nr:hypothetical protein OXYTRIMIC_264 [Oxytricha trifallax]
MGCKQSVCVSKKSPIQYQKPKKDGATVMITGGVGGGVCCIVNGIKLQVAPRALAMGGNRVDFHRDQDVEGGGQQIYKYKMLQKDINKQKASTITNHTNHQINPQDNI